MTRFDILNNISYSFRYVLTIINNVEILRISPFDLRSFFIRVFLPRRTLVRLTVGRTRISAPNPLAPSELERCLWA